MPVHPVHLIQSFMHADTFLFIYVKMNSMNTIQTVISFSVWIELFLHMNVLM